MLNDFTTAPEAKAAPSAAPASPIAPDRHSINAKATFKYERFDGMDGETYTVGVMAWSSEFTDRALCYTPAQVLNLAARYDLTVFRQGDAFYTFAGSAPFDLTDTREALWLIDLGEEAKPAPVTFLVNDLRLARKATRKDAEALAAKAMLMPDVVFADAMELAGEGEGLNAEFETDDRGIPYVMEVSEAAGEPERRTGVYVTVVRLHDRDRGYYAMWAV